MAIKTIQIADKTTLDAINTLLTNGTYGLSALNKDLDSLISSLGNGTYGLSALNKDLDSVLGSLRNGTYGLSAIKSLLADSTYGLSALKTAISGVSSGGGGYSSVSTGKLTLTSKASNYMRTSSNITISGEGLLQIFTNSDMTWLWWYLNIDGTTIVDMNNEPGMAMFKSGIIVPFTKKIIFRPCATTGTTGKYVAYLK